MSAFRNLQPGDHLNTGTIFGSRPDELGRTLELMAARTKPVQLINGERRGFLLDGDEIAYTGRCGKIGFAPIDF